MRRTLSVPFFAISIFTTSFLLFSIQPLISRAILPWFGGAPAVWTVCMLFFQVLLLLGYAAAHALERLSSRYVAAGIFLALVVLSLILLDVVPDASLKPDGSIDPTYKILSILAIHIGFPFLVLSMASPLLQVWLSKATTSNNPYWLYSVSNIGSLLALLSYPFLIEPLFTLPEQAGMWSGVFIFAAVVLLLANFAAIRTGNSPVEEKPDDSKPLSAQTRIEIFLFSALGSVLLLGFTNHVCHDIAVIPLLWILPLAIYLITFVIAFSGASWLSTGHMTKIALLMIFLLGDRFTGGSDASVFTSVSLSFGTLFVCCMLAHAEVYARKPGHKRLTSFYLLLSAGGASGGIALGIFAPLIFSSYLELPLALLLFSIYLLRRLYEERSILPGIQGTTRLLLAIVTFVLIAFRLMVLLDVKDESIIYQTRNFFGVLRVVEEDSETTTLRGLRHGRILHGVQRMDEREALRSRTYYRATSGIARVLRARRPGTVRMGVIGLGIGEILSCTKKGDVVRFYELDPEVGQIAGEYFTFLSNSPADVEVVFGDGRLTLEAESDNAFDILFIDAFSSDAIPVHLLTREAFELYFRHLNEHGALVIHISNRHMDLSGVVASVSRALGLSAILVKDDINKAGQRDYNNRYVLVARGTELLESAPFRDAVTESLSERESIPNVWTDSYSEVLSSIDWFSSFNRYFRAETSEGT